MNCQECQDYIDPYFDSELDAGDAIQVKHHLRDCPECFQRLRSREALSGLLCNPDLKFEIPKTLPGKIKSEIRLLADGMRGGFAGRRTSPWIYVPLGLAAAMALLFGLLFLNSSGLVEGNSASLVDEVVAGHVRSLLAAHLLDVPSSDQHTVKPWFDGKLKFAPPVQDFADHGLSLIGGRLDYLNGREVAALVYRKNKHIINLFLWPAVSEVSASQRLFSRNGYNIIHWNGGGFDWWAVSDVSAADLKVLEDLAGRG